MKHIVSLGYVRLQETLQRFCLGFCPLLAGISAFYGAGAAQAQVPLVHNQSNPLYSIPCYVSGDPLGGGSSGTGDSIVGFSANDSSTITGDPLDFLGSVVSGPAPLHLALAEVTGTVWGNAWQSTQNRFFTAALVKRHAGLGVFNTTGSNGTPTGNPLSNGNQGLGGIYVSDMSMTPSPAMTTPWVNLETYGINFGAFSAKRGLPINVGSGPPVRSHDPEAFAMVGRAGIGDIDVTEDESTLFVVNLFNRSLVQVDVTAAAPPAASGVTETLLSSISGYPSSNAAGQYTPPSGGLATGILRPWALAFHNGKGYLGVVNDASLSESRNDLEAWVLEFTPNDLAAGFETVANFPLNYTKGSVFDFEPPNVPELHQWQPWTSVYNINNYQVGDFNSHRRPEPALSDIGFSKDNGMTLTFMDLSGNRLGSVNWTTNTADRSSLVAVQIGGDILRLARQEDGTWELESNASVSGSTGTFTTVGAGNGEGPGTSSASGEFYYQDNFLTTHKETVFGSLAPTVDFCDFRLPILDPLKVTTGGVATADAFDGTFSNRYQIFEGNNNRNGGFFGKAIGLGDIELLCPSPVQGIGNLVFCDDNDNGEFDEGDSGVGGVKVELYYQGDDSATVAPLKTTVTDTNGRYLFSDLAPGQYYVRIPASELSAGGNLAGKVSSTGAKADTDDSGGEDGQDSLVGGGINSSNVVLRVESEPINDGTGALAEDGNNNTSDDIVGDKAIDLTVDFGFFEPASLGNLVFFDKDDDGLYEPAEGEVPLNGVTVTLCDEQNNPIDSDLSTPAVEPLTQITGDDPSTSAVEEGWYCFANLSPGSYIVKIPSPPISYPLSSTAANSDDDQVNDDDNGTQAASGLAISSPLIALAAGEDDKTVDFGLICPPLVLSPATLPSAMLYQPYSQVLSTSGGVAPYTYSRTAGSLPVGMTLTPTGTILGSPSVGGTSTFTVLAKDSADCEEEVTLTIEVLLPAAVGDFVWKDLNRNHIQDEGEPGIQGVTVVLKDSLGALAGSTVTDAFGHYEFTGLAAGSYTLEFPPSVAPSCVLTVQNGGPVFDDSDPDSVTGKTASFTLVNGQVEDGIDAGYINPRASLGDYLWKDYDRDGVQDLGEPGIANVTVTLLDSAGTSVGTTTTDAQGFYTFWNLTPGNYSVRVPTTLPDGCILGAKDQSADDTKDSDADPLTGETIPTTLITGENDPSWDMGYLPLTNVGDYVWKDLNNNGLQEAGEPGIANVTVQLYTSTGTLIGQDTTDATGHYSFNALAPGTYQMEFPTTLPDGCKLSSADLATDDLDSDANPATGRTLNIVIGAGATELDIDAGYFSPKASLGDFVWKDLNRNGIQDGGEPGLENVTVILLDSAGNPLSQTLTDATGHYYFSELGPGTYSVQFPVNAGAGCVLTSQNTGTSETDSDASVSTGKTVPTVLVAGENDASWDAGYVSPYGAIGNLVWKDTISNGVQDAGEPGLADVPVTLLNGSGVAIGQTYTDSTGRYFFDELLPGLYSVSFPTSIAPNCNLVLPDSGASDTEDSDASLSTGRTPIITLAAGQVVEDSDAGYTSPNASLGNYVWKDLNLNGVQDASEPGISNVLVTLVDSSNNVAGSTLTDAFGYYHFTGLNPGDYSVRFPVSLNQGTCVLSPKDQGGSDATDSDADLTTGSTEQTTLSAGENDPSWDAGYIFPTASLGDYVWKDLNKNGIQEVNEPGIEGVRVTLLDSLGVTVGTTLTNGVGYYSFSDLEPGDYQVRFPTALDDGCELTLKDATTDAADSDADAAGLTVLTTLIAGENDPTWDAGYIFTRASLGDKVWKDLDRDGIQDANEPGIIGVTVNLLNSAGEVVGTAITDSLGHFLFTDLIPGTYQLQFPTTLPDGCLPTRQDQGTAEGADSDMNPSTGLTAPVVLVAGQNHVEVDAGYSNMKASLGDFVWKDLNRNGVQDAGEPGVAGVVVTLLNSALQPVGTQVTDGTGFYLFSNLAPAVYFVQFPTELVDGCTLSPALASSSTTDSNPAPGTGRTASITLAAGMNNFTIDAGYISPKASLGNYVWKDLNRDGVQDAGEPGIEGVTVTLLDSAGTAIGTRVTDATGYYSFIDLAPGDYAVQFPTTVHTDCVLTLPDTGLDTNDSDAANATGLTITTTLVAGENDVSWDAGYYNNLGSIGDYVWKDLNRNGQQDPDEPGIANVTVNLLNSSGAVVGTTVTNGEGYFLFDNLTAGSYKLRFPTTAGIGCVLTTPATGATLIDSDAALITGETIDVILNAGDAITDIDAGYISPFASLGNFVWKDDNKNGQQDADEPGIAGVVVRLRLASNSKVIGTTTTDGTGYYSFQDLVPGNYILQFPPSVDAGRCVLTTSNSGLDDTDSDAQLSGLTAAVNLTAGENDGSVDAGYVNPLASLGNYVWKDLDRDGVQEAGEPGIAAVEVRLLDSAGIEIGHTVTDGTGYYSFQSLQPGTYSIQFPMSLVDGCVITTADQGGDDAKDSDVDPTTGKTISVTLAQGENNSTLDAGYTSPKGSIGDYVWKDNNRNGIQESNEPGIEGVRVLLLNAAGVQVGLDLTDGTGHFLFTDLQPGTYSLQFPTVLLDGCELGAADLGGNDSTDNDALPTGLTAPVVLDPGQAITHLDAGYISPLLCLGDYVWLDVNHDGVQAATELGLASVKVELLNANSTPAKDANGVLVPEQTTLADGKYKFINLAPGNYIVRATPPAGYLNTIGGADPDNDNNADNNGVTLLGQTYVQSLPVTLTSNSEPANDGDVSTNSNLSVDFGFYIPKYDLALRKLIAPSQKNPVKEGEKVTFTIEVFNQGDIAVKNVKVVDYTPSGFTLDTAASPNWTIVTGNAEGLLINPIAPGDSSVTTITYTVTSSAALGAVTNWAEIFEAQDPDGLVIEDEDSTPDKLANNDGLPFDNELNNENSDEDDHDGSTITVASPGTWDLALRKTLAAGQSPSVNPGDEVTYALEVFNQGTEEARNISIIDYIPASMTLADGAWSTGPVPLSAVTTLSNPIAPGASALIDITLRVNSSATGPRTITNVAEVHSFTDKNNIARVDPDSTPDNISTNDGPMKDDAINNEDSDQDDHDIAKVAVNAPKVFDLALRKRLAQGQAASVAASGTVNFEFEVFNQGAVAATAIQILDHLPAGLSINDAAWTSLNSSQASITIPGPIQPGDSAVFTLQTQIAPTATPLTSLVNLAEIMDAKDDLGQPVTDKDSLMDNVANNDGPVTDDKIANENGDQDDHDTAIVTVAPPGVFDLALRKTLATNQNSTVNPGDRVTYTIEVFNQGAVPARGLTLTDYIPSGMSLDDSNWNDNGNGTASASFGANFVLAPSTSHAVNISLRVASSSAPGSYVNVAEISTARNAVTNLAAVDVDSDADTIKNNDGFITDNAINNESFDEDDHDVAAITVNAADRCDLALRTSLKPGQSQNLRAGDTVYYRMEVFNQGRLPASSITITDYLPIGLEFVQSMNPFWSVATANQVTCTLAGPLVPGASAQLDLCLKVAATTTAQINGNGSITNYAEISNFSCNGMPNAPDHDSTPDATLGNDGQVTNDAINNESFDEDDMDGESITILPPERFDLALRKTAKEGINCIHAPGDRVCFIMEVFNQGALTAKEIKICDYLPAGMNFSASSNTGWTMESSNMVSCVIPGPIPSGSSHAIELCLTVDPTATVGSTLRNCAEICMAKDDAGNIANDADSVADNNASNDGRMTDNAINNESFDEDDHDCQDVSIQATTPDATYQLGNYVWMDSNGNGVQDNGEPAQPGVSVTLRNSANVVVATTSTNSTGNYLFTNLAPGTYTVEFTALPGFSFSPQGTGTATDSDANAAGLATVVISNASHIDIDAGFVPAKSNWAAWLANTPAAGNSAIADTDGDGYNSLAEFAFCTKADNGIGEPCPVELKVDPNTGRIDACLRRILGGAPALQVTMESLTDLALSPAGWTPVTLTPVVTNNGNGTETVCYSGVDGIANLANQGFIRAKITLDTNGDTIPEHTTYSDVLGWSRRTVLTQCETYSQPFIKCPIFTGVAGSSSGSAISITAGSASFSGQLQAGQEYYVEVLTGPHAGHRFEVNESASTASSIALHAAHVRNTQTTVPSFSGVQIAVRAHWMVRDIFRAQFTPSMLGRTGADRLMFWNGTSFDEIWYAGSSTLTPRWTADDSSPFEDASSRVVTPCEGFFIHPRLASTSVLSYGIVRKTKLACPIQVGTFFLGSGWPMSLSPNQLSINTASGFTGSSNAANSDRIRLWLGDTNFGQEGYSSHFLLNTATRKYWTTEANASLLNENDTPFWKTTRAVFFQARTAVSSYCMPVPWAP